MLEYLMFLARPRSFALWQVRMTVIEGLTMHEVFTGEEVMDMLDRWPWPLVLMQFTIRSRVEAFNRPNSL